MSSCVRRIEILLDSNSVNIDSHLTAVRKGNVIFLMFLY